MRKRRFFYHYNKPLSKSHGRPIISVHYLGKCHFVDADKLKLEVISNIKVNKRQPYVVLQGWCKEFIEDNQTITIK